VTAEIAIFNKEALALAADSAVTVGFATGEKVFPSANKIFALLEGKPVGMMVYGNATFMGYPWETLIKVYRAKRAEAGFPTIKECAADFLNFLRTEPGIFPKAAQDQYITGLVAGYLDATRAEIDTAIRKYLKTHTKISTKEIAKIFASIVQRDTTRWSSCPEIPAVPPELAPEFDATYRQLIEKLFDQYLGKFPISPSDRERFLKVLGSIPLRYCPGFGSTVTSGVVFAGFGETELFPVVAAYELDGFVLGHLKFREDPGRSAEIAHDNDSAIIPFAQSEMVHAFMAGIEPSFNDFIFKEFRKLLAKLPDVYAKEDSAVAAALTQPAREAIAKASQAIFNDFSQRVSQVRGQHFTKPIVQVVSYLPKSDLASLAESLVSLTSLKRRVTLEVESVSGPIDVAVISKGDGFVWIKRKHYFDPSLNPRFIASLYR